MRDVFPCGVLLWYMRMPALQARFIRTQIVTDWDGFGRITRATRLDLEGFGRVRFC